MLCFVRSETQLHAFSLITLLQQVFILDSLATYKPRDGKDAESIVERVTPRLQHANCAVVLSAVKVNTAHLGGSNTNLQDTALADCNTAHGPEASTARV